MSKFTGSNTALFIAVAIAAIAIGFFIQTDGVKTNTPPKFEKLILLPNARDISIPVFNTHLGTATGHDFLKNKWSILFFGFTNCPDICPTTLQVLKNVKRELSSKGAWQNYQVVMVSVDPERDTPEQLAKYVPFFDDQFIGVTADKSTTETFAKQVGVLFFAKEADKNGRYDVDHSASLILINPEGGWAGAITAPHKQSTITNDLIKLANYTGDIQQRSAPTTQSSKQKQSNNTIDDVQNLNGTVNIQNAWIRPAPPAASTMAAYFELVNNSDQDLRIVDSQSPQFAMTMIHNTVIEDGLAKMQHMDALVVPANSRVTLEPLGKHMMLMRPVQPLALGESATIRLITEQGQAIETAIQVREAP